MQMERQFHAKMSTKNFTVPLCSNITTLHKKLDDIPRTNVGFHFHLNPNSKISTSAARSVQFKSAVKRRKRIKPKYVSQSYRRLVQIHSLCYECSSGSSRGFPKDQGFLDNVDYHK